MTGYGARIIGDDSKQLDLQFRQAEANSSTKPTEHAIQLTVVPKSYNDKGKVRSEQEFSYKGTVIDGFVPNQKAAQEMLSKNINGIVAASVKDNEKFKENWAGEIDESTRKRVSQRKNLVTDLLAMMTEVDPTTGDRFQRDQLNSSLYWLSTVVANGKVVDNNTIKNIPHSQLLLNLIENSISDSDKKLEFNSDRDSEKGLTFENLLKKYLPNTYDSIIEQLVTEEAMLKVREQADSNASKVGWENGSNLAFKCVGGSLGIVRDFGPFAQGLGTAAWIGSFFSKTLADRMSWITISAPTEAFRRSMGAVAGRGALRAASGWALGRFVAGGLLGTNPIAAAVVYGGIYCASRYWTEPEYTKWVNKNVGWIGTGAKQGGLTVFKSFVRAFS